MNQAQAVKHKYYSVNYNLDTEGNPNGFKDITINQLEVNRHLAAAGFVKYQQDSNYFFCRVIDNIVTQVTEVEIREFIFKEVAALPFWLDDYNFASRDALENKLLKGVGTYFAKDKLFHIPTITAYMFNRDGLADKFIYYKNCYAHITAGGVEIKPYKELEGLIWQSEIIQRDYRPEPINNGNLARRFFNYISGTTLEGDFVENSGRLKSLELITGYLLHNFYDYKLKAILLTDSTIAEDNEANGRTGKTLFCRLIAHTLSTNPADPAIKTFIEVNGKDFDPINDKKWQVLSIETKLCHLNDVKRYFDADSLYNDITDGVTVNRKFRDPFKINVKLIVSTNKTIKLDGESSKDRFIEFQFSDYFSSRRTPEQVFKHWFFRDWTAQQWNDYDNYMVHCCRAWINKLQLTEPENINLEARKLIEQTHPDFVDFLDGLNPGGKEYANQHLYELFLDQYPEILSDKRFNIIRFKKWIINYCNHKPGFAPYKKQTHDIRIDQKRGTRFIIE